VRRAARRNPRLESVVMGCAAAVAPDSLAPLPTVRAVLPGADPGAIARALGLPPETVGVRAAVQRGARALLRIQDGCDEHCTFCATTRARGANRSRTADAVVGEAKLLARSHSEIVLTGIHIGTYGQDMGGSLGELVERLVHDVPAVRFRLSSVEATELCERLRALIAGAPEHVAPHLHAPLQSGADRVLRRMGRHWYDARAYAEAVESLASRSAVLGLGADVIAGFPGETEAEHRATLALVEALPFTYLHVFPFSARPDTSATRLPDALPADVIADRARELRALGARKEERYRQSRIGGAADVVVLGPSGEGILEGLTGDYLSVFPSDARLRRGMRFAATLSLDGSRLQARPTAPLD